MLHHNLGTESTLDVDYLQIGADKVHGRRNGDILRPVSAAVSFEHPERSNTPQSSEVHTAFREHSVAEMRTLEGWR